MKMKKNILSAFLLSTLCFQVALANTSYVNLHAEDEATIIIEDDFTSIKLDNSKAIEKVGVSNDGNEHGLVPGSWGANVTIADESYLVYKLDTNENKEFNTLKLDINAKIWNQNDGTAHEVNAIKVFVSEDNVTFNEIKTINNQGGNFVDLEQIDLSEHANGKQTLYVKIQLVQSTSIGESQELAWLGVKIGKIKFSLTENDYVGPIIEYSHIKDDFTTESDFLNAYKMVGVSNSSSKDHGLVPGNWDANITIADESYLMYKIIADEGVFSSLSLSINAKIWNQNDGTAHNENSIKIYAGLEENNLKEVQSLGLSSGHDMAY